MDATTEIALYVIAAAIVSFSLGYLAGAFVASHGIYDDDDDADDDDAVQRAARLRDEMDGIERAHGLPPRPTSEYDGPGHHAGSAGNVHFLHGRTGVQS